MTVGDRVRALVIEAVEPVEDETGSTMIPGAPEDWDSLALMRLVLSLEEEFSLNLDFSETTAIGSVESIVSLLRDKGVSA